MRNDRLYILLIFVGLIFANRPAPPDGLAQLYFDKLPKSIEYLRIDIVQDKHILKFSETMMLSGIESQNLRIVPNQTNIESITMIHGELLKVDDFNYSFEPNDDYVIITLTGNYNTDLSRKMMPYFRFLNPIKQLMGYSKANADLFTNFTLTIDTDIESSLIEKFIDLPKISWR